MARQRPLSPPGTPTSAGLIVAAAGVVVQIVSGVSYPTLPAVFLILLIPAGLVATRCWRRRPPGA